MQIVIDIPKEFENHFNDDNFKDSFERIKADINYTGLLSGNYEIETLDMLTEAFLNSTPLDLKGLKSDMKALNCGYPYGLDYLLDCLDKRLGISLTKINKESEVKDNG